MYCWLIEKHSTPYYFTEKKKRRCGEDERPHNVRTIYQVLSYLDNLCLQLLLRKDSTDNIDAGRRLVWRSRDAVSRKCRRRSEAVRSLWRVAHSPPLWRHSVDLCPAVLVNMLESFPWRPKPADVDLELRWLNLRHQFTYTCLSIRRSISSPLW